MPTSLIDTIKTHFGSVYDHRAQHSIDHKLIDIIVITICAVICGANTWVEVENYGKAKQLWLEELLELPCGIPSHDTCERLFTRMKPTELQSSFLNWVQAVFTITAGQIFLMPRNGNH